MQIINSVQEITLSNSPMPLAGKAYRYIDFPAEPIYISGLAISGGEVQAGYLFVAAPGVNSHGAKYVNQAVTAGAVAVLTDEEGLAIIRESAIEIPIMVAENPRQEMAKIAAELYQQPANKVSVIGITGTNGKTTTSYMLRQMLSEDSSKIMLSGTINTQIGDKLLVSNKTTMESCEFQRALAAAAEAKLSHAVVEVSSHALEQYRVAGTYFEMACFTNLSPEHLDYHGSMEAYFLAKAKLFSKAYARQGVVCLDTEWGQRLAQIAEIPVQTVVANPDLFEQFPDCDWRVKQITEDTHSHKTTANIQGKNGVEYQLSISLIGRVNVQNAVVAFAAALSLGVSADDVLRRLENLCYIPGRAVCVGGKAENKPLVIVDFAHTPEAVDYLLELGGKHIGGKTHVVISHDGERQPEHRAQMGRSTAKVNGNVWVTDSNPRYEDPATIREAILSGIREVRPNLEGVFEITTWRTDAVREAILAAAAEDLVLIPIKGEEPYQEIRGVKHQYSDLTVAKEVLKTWKPPFNK